MKNIFKTVTKKGITLDFRLTDSEDVNEILSLQSLIYSKMENTEWFVKITKEEIVESAAEDITVGVYDGDKLIGFALIVKNRSCDRNLGEKFGFDPRNCFTADSSFIHPDYRGLGLQGELLDIARDEAAKNGASSVWATVSPENIYSHRNCDKRGYTVYKSAISIYGGRIRDVLVLKF